MTVRRPAGPQADRAARFERLAHEVGEPLRRYLLRRTDPDTADDVVADAFLVLWRRLDEVPDDGALPWCYAVARNCLANARRSAQRRQGLFTRIVALDPPEEQPPADAPDPAVHRALAQLAPTDREIVRLSVWEELAPREIAEVMGLTPNAVSIRLHRSRRRLAELLVAGKDHEGPGQIRAEERRAP